MIDNLDSRGLGRTDCYGQRFMKAGVYHYNVLPARGHCISHERPFLVRVVERNAEGPMKQHSVVVRFKDREFSVEPREVSIEAGDLVLWNCQDSAVPYVVAGDKPFFASDRLVNESGFTHAFGLAGEYRWRDAYGSGASGVVRVRNASCTDQAGLERWRQLIAKGTLVTVSDARAEPQAVEIVVGQTVFFAITKGPGISVTDERILKLEAELGHGASGKADSAHATA